MDLLATGTGMMIFFLLSKEVYTMSKDMMRYSMQLAMLKQLLSKKLITEKEFNTIKKELMKDYNVISNLSGTT